MTEERLAEIKNPLGKFDRELREEKAELIAAIEHETARADKVEKQRDKLAEYNFLYRAEIKTLKEIIDKGKSIDEN